MKVPAAFLASILLAKSFFTTNCFVPAQRCRSIFSIQLAATNESPRSPRGRSRADRSRRPPPSETRTRTPRSDNSGERRRAPHQFDHTKDEARPFLDDPATAIRQQVPNEDAPLFTFPGDDDDDQLQLVPEGTHIRSISLDALFPGFDFSEKFCSNCEFRSELRNAIREDIFDSTPAYSGMSEKARKMLLLPDSSLQGSWNCKQFLQCSTDGENGQGSKIRMKQTTAVLKNYLGEKAPTGDEFMEKIGSLCGSKPSTHWIDIVGIVDRRIPHSWHQDTGRSPNGDTQTVLLGFPKDDNYDGCGVFSHAIKLKYERLAKEDHPPQEPVVYPKLAVDDEYIVRPRFAKGCEIIIFRDIDVLHSSPDIAYRSSVMRFM
ncbi:hypothetical protein ACHAXS_013672 [Conticribra weissflogii]